MPQGKQGMLLLGHQKEAKIRGTGSEDAEGNTNDLDDDFVARNGRRRTSYTTTSPDTQAAPMRSPRTLTGLATSPTSPAFNSHRQDKQKVSQSSIPYYVDTKAANQAGDQDQEVANETAAKLFRTPINIPGDALHLLLEASGRTESLQRQDSGDRGDRSLPTSLEARSAEQSRYTRPPPESRQRQVENIDPAIADGSGSPYQPEPSEIKEAIRAWSRLRFVRAGYYEYLAPLTPISPPEFHSPTTHPGFLNDEPLLVVTVLTIASRYMQLTGPGAKSRSYMVHERLWSYLQNMITRMFWGQEQFGGGFCGAGSRNPTSTVKGGLRTLGTIESLLLLSEFHPRSMHFPPGDDGDDILTTTEEDWMSLSRNKTTREQPSFGETTVVSWSEPALRSDRMCWSLIGMSYTLAYELGVFGTYQDGIRSLQLTEGRNGGLSPSPYEQRIDRIERLLYIYINTASGRFGLPTMYARQGEDLDPLRIQARIMARSEAQDPIDNIQQYWMDMTTIMKTCNATLFSSKDHTQALIQSGGYVALLEQLQPLMNSYRQKLEAARITKYPWIILSIELEYVKLYIYSLALQAVLGYFTSNVALGNEDQTFSISFPTMYRRNEIYVAEVVQAARDLLTLVVDGLLPGGYLKHAPVRTHFRILSGATFLLKTFALGAKEDEVSTSLQLLDRTVQALRASVVDDVHLSLRIADLLEGITSSIRHKFVRLPARTSNSNRATPPKSTYASPAQATQSITNNLNTSAQRTQQYLNDHQNAIPNVPLTFDNNISIMPPPNSTYQFNLNSYGGNPNSNAALSPFDNNEEDWLTLNLNPLLSSETTGFQTGVGNDGQWFGNFGPEINGNLEVLGKLVEGWEMGELTGFS
ncbi:MAG: hypothetical protein Q9225_004045 [Loekoesia sp. 1 TL-2023]